MRVALCLSGLAGGKNDIGRDSGGIEHSFPNFSKHILEKNDVDVFVHSWSTQIEDKILNLLEPKKYIIEKQIKFTESKQVGGELRDEHEMGEEIMKGNNPGKVISGYNPPKNLKQQNYSQWYSRMKSVELKKEYEEENNFKYDFVMMCRFDVMFFTDIIFENFDNKYFYTSKNTVEFVDGSKTKFNAALIYKESPDRVTFGENDWKTKGMMDFWFFSNSECMDKFTNLFNRLNEYNKNHNESIGYLGGERCVVRHIQELGFDKCLKQVFHRVRDYELVRRWALNSLY